eukprot:jgi/Galph1/2746/GphlegSOOS_G1430.1
MAQDSEYIIKVKTLDSTEHSVSVNQNMTVLQLKQRLAELTGVPEEQQRLIFRGRVLKNELTLGYYKVEAENALHLVSRPTTTETADSSRTTQENPSTSASQQSSNNSTGVPRGASMFIGAVNVPLGTEDVAGVAGSIFQSIQDMLRVTQSFSGTSNFQTMNETSQVSMIQQVLQNTFNVMQQIFQQLTQQLPPSQGLHSDFPSHLPSERASYSLESIIARLDAEHDIGSHSSQLMTVLTSMTQVFQQVLLCARTVSQSTQTTNQNDNNRGAAPNVMQNILQSIAPGIANMFQQVIGSPTGGTPQNYVRVGNLGNVTTQQSFPSTQTDANVFASASSSMGHQAQPTTTNTDSTQSQNASQETNADSMNILMNMVNSLLGSIHQSVAASRANPELASEGPNSDVGLPSVGSVMRSLIHQQEQEMDTESTLEQFTSIVGDHLSFIDLIGLSQGNTNCLRRIRRPVRQQLLQYIFNHTENISEQIDLSVEIRISYLTKVHDLVERVVETEIGPELDRFCSIPSIRERLLETDVRGRVIPILKQYLVGFLNHLLENELYSDEEFEIFCRSWSYQIAGNLTYTLAQIMRNGRTDAVDSLREYISTRANETFGTQLGAIGAMGSVSIVRFASEAYDQWVQQHVDSSVEMAGSNEEQRREPPQTRTQTSGTAQVIREEELLAAADELMAEIGTESSSSGVTTHGTMQENLSSDASIEHIRQTLQHALPSQVADEWFHRISQDREQFKKMRTKPLSKAYRSGYTDSNTNQHSVPKPESFSSSDIHKFAKTQLGQAMEESGCSRHQTEEVLDHFDREHTGELYRNELVTSVASRLRGDQDFQQER